MPKEQILEKIKGIFNTSGVYIFKNKDGFPIYVGKSRNLKDRILNHLNSPIGSKSFYIVNEAYDIEIIYTEDETKAFLLEEKLIKEYKPKYNIQFKDDKTYPYLAVTKEDFPRVIILRKDKPQEFLFKCGPFVNLSAAKSLKEFLEKTFKIRTCQNLKKRECLKYHIGECSAPCINKISRKEYLENINRAIEILKGNLEKIQKDLIDLINKFAENGEYEKALFYRNILEGIKNIYRTKNFKDKLLDISTLKEEKNIVFKKSLDQENIYEIETLKREFESVFKRAFPQRAEGFDISTLQGKVNVGSCVVFINGKPEKKEYRKYLLKSNFVNDYECMKELLFRRFRRIKEENIKTELILLDGGKGQLNIAKDLKNYFGLDFYIVALAKGETRKEAKLFTEDGLYLDLYNYPSLLKFFISIRDEAHRFAKNYLWQRLKKINFEDILKDIKGLGEKRLKALKSIYKNIYELSKASEMELINLGIPRNVAKKILERLKND